MKKVFITATIVLVWVFVSCKDSTSANLPTSTTDSTSQAEKNTANTNAVYRGIETGDLSVMDSFVAVDVVDHAGMMGEINGRDSVKKMLADIHNHISNIKIDLISDATGGEYHFALTRRTGTTKDNMMGMPANTPIDHTTVDVVRMVNGKAKEHWSFADLQEMMKMMNIKNPGSKMAK